MRSPLALGLVLFVAAGCLASPLPHENTETLPSEPASILLGGKRHAQGDVVAWEGRHLQGAPPQPPGTRPTIPCPPPACETIRFELENATPGLVLRAMASWPFTTREGDADVRHPRFDLRLLTPAGRTQTGADSTYGAVLILPDPAPGAYELWVRIDAWFPDPANYQGFLRVDRPTPYGNASTEDRLPDLALSFIGDLRLTKSLPGDYAPTTAPAPWTQGCGIDEFQEHASMRCLRFAASIANVGEGPLMLFFEPGSGVQKVHQCVARTDGSTYLRPAGTGEYHQAHGHHHHSDVVDYRLYRYDLASQTRGEAATGGQKFGWGFAAQGVLPHLLPDTYADHRFFYPPRSECRALTGEVDGAYGLPRGWHDPYLTWRNGNYVDVTRVPDGVYELEILLDKKDHVLESDLHPNSGSILLRLRADTVEQLTPYQRDFAPTR